MNERPNKFWIALHSSRLRVDAIIQLTGAISLLGTYGTMYGNVLRDLEDAHMKTTLYIPDDLKASLSQIAARQGVSEAELVRQALRDLVANATPPRPKIPLFRSGKPFLAENVDEALKGFGEQ